MEYMSVNAFFIQCFDVWAMIVWNIWNSINLIFCELQKFYIRFLHILNFCLPGPVYSQRLCNPDAWFPVLCKSAVFISISA